MEKYVGEIDGQPIEFVREFGGHRFTDDEIAELLAGHWIKFDAMSRAGNTYTAIGYLETGGGRCRFKLDFDNAPIEMIVPDEWCGHEFTKSEKRTLAQGGTVYCTDLVSKRSGKYYAAELEFASEHGRHRIKTVRNAW